MKQIKLAAVACFSPVVLTILALSALTFTLTLPANAQTESVLFSINGGLDGSFPYSAVTFDAAGNIYGISRYGGIFNCSIGCGAVWEISPAVGGGWTETVLHTFTDGSDGALPYGELVTDAAGNVYGTTTSGGIGPCNPGAHGCGVVFELSPNSSGSWTETILHSFTGFRDGAVPYSGLIFDAAGNLYGTASGGGNPTACSNTCGVVFKLSPGVGGVWTETVLHAFTGDNDGGSPFGTLSFDAAGNLYGTTEGGGDNVDCGYNVSGCGVVFKLSPVAGGGLWKETVLHTFNHKDGDEPQSGVVLDAAGNLYGSTAFGGQAFGCDDGCGVVYKLSPTTSGPWKFTGLHVFYQQQSEKGFYPSGKLLLDGAGNVYGTTSSGGTCGGVVFKLSQNSAGAWVENIVHSFSCSPDGFIPLGGLISNAAGNYYGSTANGGTNGVGTVFEIVP